MSLGWTRVLQALIGVAQVLNASLVKSTELKSAIGSVLVALAVVVNEYSAKSNPDGTPATVAYIPPEKK